MTTDVRRDRTIAFCPQRSSADASRSHHFRMPLRAGNQIQIMARNVGGIMLIMLTDDYRTRWVDAAAVSAPLLGVFFMKECRAGTGTATLPLLRTVQPDVIFSWTINTTMKYGAPIHYFFVNRKVMYPFAQHNINDVQKHFLTVHHGVLVHIIIVIVIIIRRRKNSRKKLNFPRNNIITCHRLTTVDGGIIIDKAEQWRVT